MLRSRILYMPDSHWLQTCHCTGPSSYTAIMVFVFLTLLFIVDVHLYALHGLIEHETHLEELPSPVQ